MSGTVIPRGVVEAEMHRIAEAYDSWDTPHIFASYSWDGTGLHVGLLAVMDPGMDPDDYPAMLAMTAHRYLDEQPDDSPALYMLQLEGFGAVIPPADAPEAEKEAFERARETHTFHELPDHTEYLIILAADIYGRVWCTKKNRDTGELSDTFHHPTSQLDGLQVKGLRAIALATGIVRHGLVPGSAN